MIRYQTVIDMGSCYRWYHCPRKATITCSLSHHAFSLDQDKTRISLIPELTIDIQLLLLKLEVQRFMIARISPDNLIIADGVKNDKGKLRDPKSIPIQPRVELCTLAL